LSHFYDVFALTDADAALAAGIFHRREVPIQAVKQFLTGKVEIRRIAESPPTNTKHA